MTISDVMMFLNLDALQKVSFERDANKYQRSSCSMEVGIFSIQLKSTAGDINEY